MKTNLILKSLFIVAATGLIFSGCRKEDSSYDTSAVSDNAIAEASYDDAANVADEGSTGSLSTYRIGEGFNVQTTCATITHDTMNDPHVLTIDFGSSPCLCKDGNYRQGKIIVTYSGKYRDVGHTHSITFDNYYLNFNKIEGTKTVVNNGPDGNGHLSYSVTITGGVITVDPQYTWNGQGGTITYESTRTRVWIAGEPTPQFNDDVYEISGTANGTSLKGVAYSMSTSVPLRKEIGFAHFTSGILNITMGSKPTLSVDYSYLNSQRDNLARVTVNGKTYTVKLGRKF